MSEQHQISLANESQYLLISETSLLEVFKHFKRSKNLIKFDELVESFRANFVMNGHIAFEEDDWNEINVGKLKLKVILAIMHCCSIRFYDFFQKRNFRFPQLAGLFCSDYFSLDFVHKGVIISKIRTFY